MKYLKITNMNDMKKELTKEEYEWIEHIVKMAMIIRSQNNICESYK